MAKKTRPYKFYALVHPGGPRGGVIATAKRPMRRRKQDRRAKAFDGYAVIFFPKITNLGKARISQMVWNTLAQTPEAAISKFMDGMKGETWETYHDAGHRVRKVRLSDLGDA